MTHLEASPASLCKCRGVPRFFQSPPILTSRHRQKQRRPFSQHVCASVAHTAEGALSVKPASVKVGIASGCYQPCIASKCVKFMLHVDMIQEQDFKCALTNGQGGTFTVNGSLETGCDPELIYQTLVDYPNLPNVFKNLDACRSWTEAGQKKLLQVRNAPILCFSFAMILVALPPRFSLPELNMIIA